MNSRHDLRINSDDADFVRHVEKDVELRVLKDSLSNNYDLLQQRKILLAEEYKELDDVNFSVWAAEDEYCNEIWKFSHEHNFDALFNQSSDALDPRLELDQVNRKSCIAEVGEDANGMLKNLENEIDAIAKDLSLVRERDIKREIKDAFDKLNDLRLLSEEISEVIRLTKPRGKPFKNISNTHLTKNIRSPYSNRRQTKPWKASLNDNDNRKNSPVLRNQYHWKKSRGNNATEFRKASVLVDKPICRPCIVAGNKTTTTAMTVTEGIKSEHSTGGKRISKFVVKERSRISLKLQQNGTVSEKNT